MPDAQSPSFDEVAVSDPGPANRLFYPALDGFRAIAFLIVFGHHYLTLSWGWAGVDFFFVLSGFLITGILYDTRNDTHRIWNFYVRRTLRIFPLFYGTFLLIVLVDPFFRWQWNLSWLAWPAYVGNYVRFVHPIVPGSPFQLLSDAQLLSQRFPRLRLYLGHFWSLCIEEQFYLLWPWVVFWIRDLRRLLYVCAACVAVIPILRQLASTFLPPFMVHQAVTYSALPFRIDALLLGGLIALLLREGYGETLLRMARLTFAGCVMCVLIWLALNPYARTMQLQQYPDWKYTWGLSFMDVFAASILLMAIHPGTWAYRLLMPAPLRWIGRVSYGAYVLHDIPHSLYSHLAKNFPYSAPMFTALIALACTLLLAGMSYRFFESPFIRLKDRLSR